MSGVEGHIERQKSPQREICGKLRELILAAAPGIREEVKWGVPNYGTVGTTSLP